MTKSSIVQRLLDEKKITAEEAAELLREEYRPFINLPQYIPVPNYVPYYPTYPQYNPVWYGTTAGVNAAPPCNTTYTYSVAQ